LEVSRIRYIVSEKNYVTLITDQQRVMALLSMDKVLEMLPVGFVRVHKSYIVAVKHVDVIEKLQLYIGETEIPIGDAYRKAFFEHIDG
jgi:two-component system, LytTR family, response regulator